VALVIQVRSAGADGHDPLLPLITSLLARFRTMAYFFRTICLVVGCTAEQFHSLLSSVNG
jgi:hypothetical protein